MQKALQFLKQHYEKLVLCAVIVCLVWAAVALPKQVSEVKETPPPPPPPTGKAVEMAPLNTAPLVAAIEQVTNPPNLTMSGEHNLFNPVVWKRKSNGDLIKLLKTGADALEVSNIAPQYLTIAIDRQSGDGFFMYAQGPSGHRTNSYLTLNEVSHDKSYKLVGTNEPLKVVLLNEDNKEVEVSKNRPYQEVVGYITDLYYRPDLKNFPKEHVDSTFTLDGDPYKIVAITADTVTVQQSTTTERTTISWNGKPEAASRP